jgi:hypothetical protein
MEDNLNEDLNFYAMEDDLNCFINGRRPQLFYKWKTTSIVLQMFPKLLLDGKAGPGPVPEEAYRLPKVNKYLLQSYVRIDIDMSLPQIKA